MSDLVNRQAVIECFFDSDRKYRNQIDILHSIRELPNFDNDRVLEEIKGEIETMADLSAKSNDKTLFGGLELALGIIDKHIGKEIQ